MACCRLQTSSSENLRQEGDSPVLVRDAGCLHLRPAHGAGGLPLQPLRNAGVAEDMLAGQLQGRVQSILQH